MKTANFNEKNNFIKGWYIDPKICQNIIERFEQRKILSQLDTSKIRNYSYTSLDKLGSDLHNNYIQYLTECIKLYYKEYKFLDNVVPTKIWGNNFVNIQKYKKGLFYNNLHCENYGLPDNKTITMVFMTYLNSISEGGGTHWPHQNLQTTAEQGLTVIWPAYWTHPHIGIVSNSDIKYIATGWIEFIT